MSFSTKFCFHSQGLYDKLGSHEDAVQELKVCAQPLVEFCDDNVAQDIESTMQKAVVKWNETNDNLKQICKKYKGAVKLWRKYCEESEAIRNVVDQYCGGVDDLMEDKSAEEIEVSLSLESSAETFPVLTQLRAFLLYN